MDTIELSSYSTILVPDPDGTGQFVELIPLQKTDGTYLFCRWFSEALVPIEDYFTSPVTYINSTVDYNDLIRS